jgi:hypothetical protein
LHKLTASFVLGYHGCDRKIGERLLRNQKFQFSQNNYDWLGSGIYFWEANPLRGLQFAREVSEREPQKIKHPFVIGAILDLGNCLDLTTHAGLVVVKEAYESLAKIYYATGEQLPTNHPERFRHPLDCAVINYLHFFRESQKEAAVDSVKALFTEGGQLYPGSEFQQKNHIQIVVRNLDCIKGVFRVPKTHLDPTTS